MDEREPRGMVVDQERIVAMMERALEGRRNEEGLFAQEIVPPEKDFVDLAKEYGERAGSEKFALHAVFFLTPTVFADNSTQQLKYASDPSRFAAHAWLFEPERVALSPEEEFLRAAKDFIRPGYNVRALPGWQHNARLLMSKYDGDLRNFFAEYQNDAPTLLQALIGPKRKMGWEGFHRFGPKVGRLFLQWVEQYELAPLNRADEIGIPVDFQVARLVIQTGGVKLFEAIHKHWVLGELVPLLPLLLQRTALSPQLTSETLWLIGNRCCNPYRHDLCPLSELCDRLISRERFDDEGLFDPKDVGRYYTKATKRAVQRREKLVAAGQGELLFS